MIICLGALIHHFFCLVMSSYSIKDLEGFTGIKAHTLRIWEKRYHVLKPQRTSTNIRTYDDEDLKRILNISILNRHGYRISDIIKLSEKEICEKVMQLSQRCADTHSQIENLLIAMIEMNEEIFHQSFNQSVLKSGFEDTFRYLIFPFFERVGLLWQSGSITPAQEHFVSNLIRQKLIVAIDSIISPRKPNALHFVLFLPEGEWHEIGLLFTYYLIKKWGHYTLYFGANLPIETIQPVLEKFEISFVVTQFINGICSNDLNRQIQKLAEVSQGKKVLLSGAQIIQKQFDMPNHFYIYEDIDELREIIDIQRA